MRLTIEAIYSFLENHYSMVVSKVRVFKNVAVYALYSVLSFVLTRETAENIIRPAKLFTSTYFNT
jgi:hypothetical protein